jgi:hypothetical protein
MFGWKETLRRWQRWISVMPLEGDFSEEFVAMLGHQPVEPVAKRLHERKCEEPRQQASAL